MSKPRSKPRLPVPSEPMGNPRLVAAMTKHRKDVLSKTFLRAFRWYLRDMFFSRNDELTSKPKGKAWKVQQELISFINSKYPHLSNLESTGENSLTMTEEVYAIARVIIPTIQLNGGTSLSKEHSSTIRLFNKSIKKYSNTRFEALMNNPLWERIFLTFIESGDLMRAIDEDKSLEIYRVGLEAFAEDFITQRSLPFPKI